MRLTAMRVLIVCAAQSAIALCAQAATDASGCITGGCCLLRRACFRAVKPKAILRAEPALQPRVRLANHHVTAEMKAAAGSVRIHATTILPATPQRTAETR